ncbi:uncharacterized protein BO95DRAFT_437929 [Aspergillus brunneoviolaceus CBS 621.78]|uniref:Uncharacterized protein n=1 Tax=Aspergillus brunneoviolaceus CBS 621.78 TaxID=1450534 RepID=A0ACD1GPJ1_9EURO|nr:hypothetical protein BO95DRAFT_437929 [Aspergillus brunneoviolaceus CBS 621.78]RAH51176.1 hypothetical protein BO95DRAFT_437929 [Aspergillus brunneoviolaceus CBS 621.78]
MPVSFAVTAFMPPAASATPTALSPVAAGCSKHRLDRFSNSCRINVPQSQNSLTVFSTIWQELCAVRPSRATILFELRIRS